MIEEDGDGCCCQRMRTFFIFSASRLPLLSFCPYSAFTPGSSARRVDSFLCNSIAYSPSFSDWFFLHDYLLLNKPLLSYFNFFSVQWHFNFCFRLYRTFWRRGRILRGSSLYNKFFMCHRHFYCLFLCNRLFCKSILSS